MIHRQPEGVADHVEGVEPGFWVTPVVFVVEGGGPTAVMAPMDCEAGVIWPLPAPKRLEPRRELVRVNASSQAVLRGDTKKQKSPLHRCKGLIYNI